MQNQTHKSQPYHTQKIGFILLHGFTMITFASAVDVLRMANYLSQKELYSWYIYQEENGTPASNGLGLQDSVDAEALFDCDMVFVCGGVEVQKATTPTIKTLLKQLDHQGMVLGSLCNGSVALASAKLMDGYKASLHWEALSAAKEAFYKVEFSEQLYTIDRNRYTCAGGTASMDMMLHLIRLKHGKTLATAVAQQFVMDRIRDASTTQYMTHTEIIGPGYEYVQTAIELMQANLDEVLSMQEIAELIPLSLRQMERLFKRYCHVSPAQYYLRLRLQRAKELLAQTSMSVMQVTVACGFSTSSHFSKAYRNYYGYSPRDQRKPIDPEYTYRISGSGGVINSDLCG
ncbi:MULTISPECIES: GlxA family transcriptional regulator [Vitreoscilla]|uniref:GlxA family transcriptional regulator n=1 Tax=Vitreoscilla stercoraria TaxID=61 RepID=A0ABY4E7I8_VITST|nr:MULTISPECIES: GlxA family transcriptional regulator [Vitreoscilla]AUZ05009.2 putative amidotransferase [Vitreoscilla sp. C1]UOO91355.1 GlxA family transcriptional regulator [Vitreoscilla stercoraria]